MNIWNKVFLGVIFVAAIAVVALASVEFQVRNRGQATIKKLEEEIAERESDIAKIRSGIDPLKLLPDKSLSELSFDELKKIVHARYDERGRAWFGCIAATAAVKERPPDPDSMLVEARIIITGPFMPSETGTPTDVARPDALRGVVYVFEEGAKDDPSDPGVFLGRFSVASEPDPSAKFFDDDGNEKNGYWVTLVTVDPISEAEIDQIGEAVQVRKLPWALYLTPPVDRIAGIFDQLTEEAKQAIPEEIREKFQSRPMPELTDEEKEDASSENIAIWKKYRATWDDPESEFAQDYSALLDWLYQQRSSLNRSIKEAKSAIAQYQASQERAKAEEEKLEKQDIPLEEKRAAAMEIQRDKVEALLEQYKKEIANIVEKIENLQTLSKSLVEKVTAAQLEAAEKIEERAKDVVQRKEEK